MFPNRARITDAKAELFRNDVAVPAWVSFPEKPVAPGLQRNTICVIAKQPLELETTYRVAVSARVDGRAWERTWSFRTAGERPPDLAETAGQILARVNYHRRYAGLAPVSLDADQADACLAHARYLVRNFGHPAVQGLGMHTEDPKLPGYTDAGKKAGEDSVIAMGMTPLLTVEEWIATLYHRIPLLDPNLGSIAFGYARGGRGGWMTVVNARAGLGKPHIIAYPPEGDADVPTSAGKAGFPITVQFPAGRAPQNVVLTLRDAAGREVPAMFQKEPDAAFSLTPRDPLDAATRYTVEMRAEIGEKKPSWRWSFRTR
jgi:uncharacterized protein YkwD